MKILYYINLASSFNFQLIIKIAIRDFKVINCLNDQTENLRLATTYTSCQREIVSRFILSE